MFLAFWSWGGGFWKWRNGEGHRGSSACPMRTTSPQVSPQAFLCVKQGRPKKWWPVGNRMWTQTIRASIAEVSAKQKECPEQWGLWICGREKSGNQTHDFEGRTPREKYSLEGRSKAQARNHSFPLLLMKHHQYRRDASNWSYEDKQALVQCLFRGRDHRGTKRGCGVGHRQLVGRGSPRGESLRRNRS